MATMVALGTVTVGAGGSATISVTNIPQTYTDLLVKFSLRHSNSQSTVRVTFNSNTSTNYKWIRIVGDGSSVYTDNQSTYGAGYNTALFAQVTSGVMTANGFGNGEIYIPNYVSNNNKSSLVDSVSANNSTAAPAGMLAGLLENTSAVTSIEFAPENAGGTFAQYSTVTVYGVFSGPETLPTTPTIGTATDAGTGTSVSVAFTPTSATGVDASYTALSTPGSLTGTGTSSPVTVSGLTTGTAYTFQVRANNPGGSSAYSSASNSVTPAAPSAYESIASVTVGAGGTANIDFTSIPQTYKHLQLRVLARSTDAAVTIEFDGRFNGDTSASYGTQTIYSSGSGTPATFGGGSGNYMAFQRISGANAASGIFGTIIIDVLDYTNTSKVKTARQIGGMDNNGSGGVLGITSNLWNNTGAINRFTLLPNTGNFAQHTQISLYGIKDS